MSVGERALVITGSEDPMWPFLRAACTRDELARVVAFFTDRPDAFSCTYWPGTSRLRLCLGDEVIEGSDVRAVWWRAVVTPVTDARADLAEYCSTEYAAFYHGLETMLPAATWVSEPSAIERARSKPRQLAAAKALGFRMLDTAFTNDPVEVRERAFRQPSVFKSIRSPRVPIEPGSYHTVFTTRLDEASLAGVEGVLSCPGIVQEFLPKAADVRVTVIGDEVFGVLIDSQAVPRSSTDFRLGARALAYRPYEVPDGDAARCRSMLRLLGLNYGAFDFGLAPAGELVFFEVNPNGQWGWLEEATGLPMRRALINLLLSGSAR